FADLQGASFCQEFHVASALPKRSSFLGEADFTGANLATADLRAVDCQRAILVSAALVSADLRGADLRNANFQNADLTNANLSDANLCHANFTGANLAGANTTDVKLADTVLPDGSISRYETLSLIKAKVARFQKLAWKPIVERRDGERTASKFGGHPWIGEDEEWPRCPRCAEPMQAFLQLNLGQLPQELEGCFGNGLLQLFYCISEAECEQYLWGWEAFSKCQLLRVIQPNGIVATENILEIQGNSSIGMLERVFQPQTIVSWQQMEDYPNWIDAESQGASIAREELSRFATDSILDSPHNVSDFRFMDEKNRKRNERSQRDTILTDFMMETALIPPEGDKLSGWPHWVQDDEYPKCPTCDRLMDTLIFEFDSYEYMLSFCGDVGTGYILQCPDHKEQVAFLWQC
ncbi:MAG: pentapeptide repeat-containing protein, partial [Leptolyngbyaceae cyanobacterium]